MKINKEKIKNKTLQILEEIAKFASELNEVIEPLTYSGLKRRCYYMEGDPRRYSKWYHTNLGSMERRGYVKINRKSDSIELTNKGRIKLLENSTEKGLDGKWRMLSWDIPEKYLVKRRQFCSSIRRIGYKQVQKSLWACPYIRADEISLITEELGLQKYVAYLRVDKTDIENYLNKLFKNES